MSGTSSVVKSFDLYTLTFAMRKAGCVQNMTSMSSLPLHLTSLTSGNNLTTPSQRLELETHLANLLVLSSVCTWTDLGYN